MNRRNALKAAVAGLPEIGQRFGAMTVVQCARLGRGHRLVLRCDCGSDRSASLSRLEYYQSCGCKKRELIGQKHRKHGHATNAGFTPEYIAWGSMVKRCTNPKARRYERYGGRGIRVCDRWLSSFAAFYGDMGRKPTPSHQLDRIDNDGDYEPGNVRWATPRDQARNTSRNHLLTLNGITQSIVEWSEQTGIKQTTIRRRLKCGWTVEKALTSPVRAS